MLLYSSDVGGVGGDGGAGLGCSRGLFGSSGD